MIRPLSRVSQIMTGFQLELEPSEKYPGPPSKEGTPNPRNACAVLIYPPYT